MSHSSASAARTYVAQRPTLRDVPPAVSTDSGPAWPLVSVPVALVPIALAFIGINRQMWIDEYVTFYVTKLTWAQFWHLIRHQDLVHATYYVFMRIWVQMAGTSLIALRMPSILGMGVAAGALTLLGRRLFSTRAGVLAGLVFGVLPTVSRYGQEVRSYALVSALTVIATVILTYAVGHPERHWWLLYTGLMIGLGCLHIVATLMLVPHALLVWHGWRRERDRGIAWWLLCAVVTVAALAPLLYYAKGQSSQVEWITADSSAVSRYPADLFGSRLTAGVVVGLGLIGGVRLAAQKRAGNAFIVLAWGVLPPIFCYATFSLVHLFLAKYALYTLPAWALLIGGIAGVPKRVEPAAPDEGVPAWVNSTRPRWLGGVGATLLVVVTLAVAAAGFPAQREVRRDPVAGEPDFRGAAEVLEANYRAGDGVAYVGTYRWARIPFVYELKTATPKDVFVGVAMADNGWFYPQDCGDPAKCVGKTPRVWLVVSNYASDDWTGLPDAEAKVLRANYAVKTTTTLDNIRVVLLQRKR